jgi:hypothetical protein
LAANATADQQLF